MVDTPNALSHIIPTIRQTHRHHNNRIMTAFQQQDDWRRHGKEWRQILLRQDEKLGGTSFLLNSKVPIQNYFIVGERALVQFREMYETRSSMEEVYVMGHRLVAFLKHALPRHTMFDAPENFNLRIKRRQDLDWIQNRLDVVALRVDEEEWNQFILRDLNSTIEGRSGDSDRRTMEVTPWENFSGWTMVSEAEFSWDEAHNVSFEGSENGEEISDEAEDDNEEEAEDDIEEAEDDVEEASSDESGERAYDEIEGGDDARSEHSNDVMSILETDDYSLWHITAVEESIDGDSRTEKDADHIRQLSDDSALSNFRRSPVKRLSDAISSALKRPPRKDPPGMYFTKINCFASSRSNHDFDFDYRDARIDDDGDAYGRYVNVEAKDDKENETISTAPSDEDDSYPRWRSRVGESGGGHLLLYAPESNNRFRAYSS